jgi:hypothetical protein
MTTIKAETANAKDLYQLDLLFVNHLEPVERIALSISYLPNRRPANWA